MSQNEESNNASASANLGSYFNNSTRSIFDEIVSSSPIDLFAQAVNAKPTAHPSRNIFESDSTYDELSDQPIISDCHRDAWIPSASTSKLLRSVATSPGITQNIDKENLTMPGLAIAEDMTNPLKDAVVYFLGEEEASKGNAATMLDVPQDEKGLRILIKGGCYRAAVNLTGRLLSLYGQGFGKANQPSKHTPYSLQLWFTRLCLLVKLRQADVLESESVLFGTLDKPDMYFMFYPELYGTRTGSMASFAFRLLLAEVPFHYGKGKKAIDNLFALLAIVKKIVKNLESDLSEEGNPVRYTAAEKNDSLNLWKARQARVIISITNCSLHMKNYILANELMELLLNGNWRKDQAEILKAAQGRMHLALGDVPAAEKNIPVSQTENSQAEKIREQVDRGLMAVAQNSFLEALKCFEKASELDPSNIMLKNNISVCLLYTGQLEAAVKLMENVVTLKVPHSLQEVILLNLCTLYELHTTHSKQSKLHLLRQINKYNGDSTNIQCLKLSI
ncbi:unnamed protein product [Trichogramma brassicae]|uniref:Uncharacterized protein n=1 Tax=Trichogramma brassicae TaxID=86971 RepID=A0A6H5J7G5_9HYME|nr:unnamed protein product [Trichogramma brassicae]